jgi:hypothetical protein
MDVRVRRRPGRPRAEYVQLVSPGGESLGHADQIRLGSSSLELSVQECDAHALYPCLPSLKAVQR